MTEQAKIDLFSLTIKSYQAALRGTCSDNQRLIKLDYETNPFIKRYWCRVCRQHLWQTIVFYSKNNWLNNIDIGEHLSKMSDCQGNCNDNYYLLEEDEEIFPGI